jgi:D-tyrosyl-tRNA(Tyr) deacylase
VKAVVQRVRRACVRVDGRVVGEIDRGMVVLLGVMRGDGATQAQRLAQRIAAFRFFPDAEDRMNRSALEVAASALVISQFTLAADGRKGRRPSFDAAAPPQTAEGLYEGFVAALAATGLTTATGRFGARMEVELVGDGPVTFVLEEPGPAPPSGTGSGTGDPSQVLA